MKIVHSATIFILCPLLPIEPPANTEFEAILKDFKKQEGYGALAAAMFLARGAKKPLQVGRKYPFFSYLFTLYVYIICQQNNINIIIDFLGNSGKRVFKSSILGGVIGQGDPKVYEKSAPLLRAQALVQKIIQK